MKSFTWQISRLLLVLILLLCPATFRATTPQGAPNINVTGQFANNKVQRGRSVQATVIMDIPAGYHVNSSKPLEKFLVPTQLQIEAPKGIRVGPVVYPRAVMKKFSFSKNHVSVYEGRATIKASVTVLAGYASDTAELKARLRFQSCNNESCFPPQTKEISLSLGVQ